MASYSELAGLGGQGGSTLTIGDLFEQYKYCNTVGLQFLDGHRADIRDVREILDKLGLTNENIVGIQKDTENRYSRLIMKFNVRFLDLYEQTRRRHGEVINVYGYGEKRILLQDMSSNKQFVAVIGVPFEVPHDLVKKIMSRFGEVFDIRMNRYQSSLKGITTGTRVVLMTVVKKIPSVIIVGKKKINISYEGQEKTCSKCGMFNHIAYDCETPDEERVNVADDTNFPLLQPNNIPIIPTPNETIIEETVQEETTPEETIPEENAPVEIAPVEIAPVEIAPVEIAPVEIAPEEIRSEAEHMLEGTDEIISEPEVNATEQAIIPSVYAPDTMDISDDESSSSESEILENVGKLVREKENKITSEEAVSQSPPVGITSEERIMEDNMQREISRIASDMEINNEERIELAENVIEETLKLLEKENLSDTFSLDNTQVRNEDNVLAAAAQIFSDTSQLEINKSQEIEVDPSPIFNIIKTKVAYRNPTKVENTMEIDVLENLNSSLQVEECTNTALNTQENVAQPSGKLGNTISKKRILKTSGDEKSDEDTRNRQVKGRFDVNSKD